MTERPLYKKRLQEHLRETKRHANQVEKRIKQLGGKADDTPAPGPVGDAASAVASVANKAVSAAKGPLHMIRGTGDQEKMLKNAKTEYWNEHEEIATYRSIESLAQLVGDGDTAKLAKGIIREEERMAKFLEKLIPQLTKAVAQEEIPASERRSSTSRKRASSSRSRTSASSRSSASTSGRSRASSSGSGSTRKRSTTKASTKSTSSRSSAKAGGRKSTASRASTSKSSPSGSRASASKSSASGSRASASKSSASGSRASASKSSASRSSGRASSASSRRSSGGSSGGSSSGSTGGSSS